jgi:hypothetical protein
MHMTFFLFDAYRLLQVLSVIMSANPVWLINQIKWFLIQFTCIKKYKSQYNYLILVRSIFYEKLPSKEKKYVMFGWTWEIKHKMYCLILRWVCVRFCTLGSQ